MAWSLYDNGAYLKPLVFSNNKNQEDIVNEVLDEISRGERVIFIRGACGTGKSAIALNIAKEVGRASVIVPIKSLQMQYKRDYEKNKYVLKNNKDKLKISVITGRANHKCKFLKENKKDMPVFKKEVNSKLFDIFENKDKSNSEKNTNKNISADNRNIPCKIKLSEKNWNKIKEYIKQNKEVSIKNFADIKDVKRLSVALACPYWSPVFESRYEFKQRSMANAIKKRYIGVNDNEFIFYYRKAGCAFYEQFNDYIDSDVIVFNSQKYKLEFALGRKPKTDIEIIDECDEFLDSLSNQRKINLGFLQGAISGLKALNEKTAEFFAEINDMIIDIRKSAMVQDAVIKKEILHLRETPIFVLLNFFLKNQNLLEEIDEESYIFDVFETAKIFEDYIDESYVIFERKDDSLTASVVTINLEKKFNELRDKNKVLVLMSGTLHSEEVLRNIFGINNFKVIEAETKLKGKIRVMRVGGERDCKYSNFSNGFHDRESYLKTLNQCVKDSIKPALVHVTAFSDLPNNSEKEAFGLDFLISREELRDMQSQDSESNEIKKFKQGKKNVLFSTKASRGIDFPGKECRSIIFTKYPNPDVNDPFWKILKKNNPLQYWSFYRDRARRDLIQKVYRGLRSEKDFVYLFSPDSRVLDFFEMHFS